MHDAQLEDIMRRLAKLEQTSVRYRGGEVIHVDPLDVALGGSDVAYTNVKAIEGLGLEVGDQVATLVFANDLLVLGRIGGGQPFDRMGTVTITWPGATSISNSMTVPHGLVDADGNGISPNTVQATANDPSLNPGVTSVDATNIVIRCQEVNGSIKGAGSFGAVRWYVSID